MSKASLLRHRIERNGLILIALAMVLLYWVLDSMMSEQVLARTLIVTFVIIYVTLTQILINSREEALREKEKAQQQLIQAEKLAALGVLAAGIAHEVKNPLAVILQGVEYLKSSTGTDAHLLDVIERINKSILRADNIIKGLLSFTRQSAIRAENADPVSLIEEALTFVEHQIKTGHIKIVRQYEPDLPNVTVDSNRLKQVFVNLLLNAFDAMKSGGTVTIRVESIMNEKKKKRHLRIVLADTGCGIPESKIEKVFDPFYTTKNTPGNTGLGLSVTRGIIDQHGGSIRIESEVDRGTRVIVEIPADPHSQNPQALHPHRR